MKRLLKRVWRYLDGINGLMLVLYVSLVLATQALLDRESKSYILRWAFFGFAASAVICPVVLRKVRNITICPDASCFLVKEKVWKVLFFLLPFLAFLARYIVYYPGGMSTDTFVQYEQTITNQYNDWHPVIQTLLVIKLPLLLTGGWIGSMTLFQIIAFALVIGYALCTVMKYAGVKYAAISLLLILLNPTIANAAMFPWKDVSFAIGGLLLMSFALRIYCTKGQWIKCPAHIAVFAITAALTTLFRHNAILFTGPLVLAVLFCISWKRALALGLSILLLVAGILYPLYGALKVEEPDQRQVETLGLPMTVIGGAVTFSPEKLDADILEFAYRVAPKEVWEENYLYGEYNALKWNVQTDNSVIEEYGAVKVISMAVRCILQSPEESLKALVKLTNVVYSISDDSQYYVTPIIVENDQGIQMQGSSALQSLNYSYTRTMVLLLPQLFMYIGVMHLVLLVGVLAKCKLGRWKDWKKIFFILPVFCYNFGSALLLTGAADCARMFFYTYLLMPLLLIFIFRKENEGSADVTVCENV